ncbi:ATP-dependent DNA helicase [Trichonephila clavipes]|uniref:ATP-dependent DNA helicase n=1 Tax=Trichonephila clavipes TaxID=2585209 RepID=A0A8X6VTG3_TRICX|nr:ATP-dependent DNA helicase [Trichonephila clavipes]
MPPSKTELEGVGAPKESGHRVHLGSGNENLDSDFRNFPNLAGYCRNEVEWLCDRVPQLLPDDPLLFKTIDTIVDENKTVNFPTEFLNSLDITRMPPHNLRLKIGSLVIFLRNLNPPRLCNDTCLFIKRTTGKLLEAITLTV